MPHYVGLDVSQKATTICVIDEQGQQLWRGACATDPVRTHQQDLGRLDQQCAQILATALGDATKD